MGQKPLSDRDKLFYTQIGQAATVLRGDEKGAEQAIANRTLRELGASICPSKFVKYLGSAAVHVYYNETLKQLFIISQPAPLQECAESLAVTAINDLAGSVKEFFGKKRAKLRSGF